MAPPSPRGSWIPFPPDAFTAEGRERLAREGWARLGLEGTPREMLRIHDRFSRTETPGQVTLDMDVEALDARWAHDALERYVGPGGTGDAVGTRYVDFFDHLRSGRPITPAETHFDNGRLFLTNRHRFAVLRDLGLPRLPVTIDMAEVPLFEQAGLLATGSWSITPLALADVFDPRARVVAQDLQQLGFGAEAARYLATFPWDTVAGIHLYGTPEQPVLAATVSISRGLTVEILRGNPILSLGLPGDGRPIPIPPAGAAYLLGQLDRLPIPQHVLLAPLTGALLRHALTTHLPSMRYGGDGPPPTH